MRLVKVANAVHEDLGDLSLFNRLMDGLPNVVEVQGRLCVVGMSPRRSMSWVVCDGCERYAPEDLAGGGDRDIEALFVLLLLTWSHEQLGTATRGTSETCDGAHWRRDMLLIRYDDATHG